MRKNCNFCKKVREKIFNKAKHYVDFHLNIQKILDVKKSLENKKFERVDELKYTFTKNLLKTFSSSPTKEK